MTHVATEKYIKDVEDVIISSGYTYTFIKFFLSDEQIAR